MPQPKLHKDHAARQAAYRRRQAAVRRKEQQARGLPALPSIPSMPGTARWEAAIQMASSVITDVLDEMRHYFDDRTPEWKQTSRADTLEEQMRNIEKIIARLEDVWY